MATAPDDARMIERRRHFVYVTRTGEYHVRDGVCVAVRRRGQEGFEQGHLCEKRALARPGAVGQPLSFEGALASPVVVEKRRPPREDVARYVPRVA